MSTPDPRVGRSRGRIVAAALPLFLDRGFDGVSVETIAAAAGVSAKTVFNVFTSKERLFLGTVESVVATAEEYAGTRVSTIHATGDLPDAMIELAATVLSERVVGLRRLLIGELARFPDLAPDYYRRAPGRVLDSLAAALGRLRAAGLLHTEDNRIAAEQLAFLAFGASLDEAMLGASRPVGGDGLIRRRIESGVALFLAGYGHN